MTTPQSPSQPSQQNQPQQLRFMLLLTRVQLEMGVAMIRTAEDADAIRGMTASRRM